MILKFWENEMKLPLSFIQAYRPHPYEPHGPIAMLIMGGFTRTFSEASLGGHAKTRRESESTRVGMVACAGWGWTLIVKSMLLHARIVKS
jgi:hypothetical protein